MQAYSQLRDQKRNSLAAQLPLAHPWSMFIELTNRCNFKCTFCPESIEDYADRVGGISAMTFDHFRKICADVVDLGQLKVLRLYMLGEPFLHKDLPDMVAYAKENRVAERIEVTSNGTALTPKTCERVIKSGLDYLRISIYAMNPERHRTITQSQISPDQIKNNVRTLYEMRQKQGSPTPFLYVKMINPFDQTEEESFINSYKDICDEVIIEQPMNWDDPDEFDFLNKTYEKNEKFEKFDRDSLLRDHKQVCPFPFYSLVVHSSGDVSVCCVDWEKKTVCGNIFKESLREIWNGERLREFRRMHIERRKHENDACRNCTFLNSSYAPDNIDEITDFNKLYPDQAAKVANKEEK
jgi:radical SAM protein with 4Fe4S-binding SPASM domain